MSSDLVAFTEGASQNIGILFDTFTEHEKCDLDVSLCEQIEQFGSERRVGSVIKGHGDLRLIDMDGVESDARLGWRGRFNPFDRSGLWSDRPLRKKGRLS